MEREVLRKKPVRWQFVVLLASLLASAVIPWRATAEDRVRPAPSPANQTASPDAAGLLKFLHNLPQRTDHRVLSGQNIGHANQDLTAGYTNYFRELGQQTGKQPAILGVCYGWEDLDPSGIAKANALLIQHWRDGGLVTISMSPRNPWTGGGLRDRTLGVCDYQDILRPGTEPHRRWVEVLRVVADGLSELRQAGVVVLWRPLHEMNGDFFWWSAGRHEGWASPQEFAALWKFTFEYLTVERKLDNLLWVYAPNAPTAGVQSVAHFYPGDQYVDVVGLDYYGNSLADPAVRRGFQSLHAFGKPMGFSEVGPAFWLRAHPRGDFDNVSVIRSIRADYPQATFFVYWHGWSSLLLDVKMGIVQNRNAAALLNDPWVITRGSVDWR
jgi:mannan endo-1,4-beta-mannosidase